MLERIEQFFRERLLAADGNGLAPNAHPLAVAALMFEVVRADAKVDHVERRRVRELLAGQFELSIEDLDELEALAEQEVEEATDLYQFTRLVTEHCDAQARIDLIEALWRVALADGVIDPQEEHTIRRIAGLIHVRQSDFIATRQRARTANSGTP